MLNGTYFFECDCGSDEHILRFTLDTHDEHVIYAHVFLNQHRNIFERIWIAIKYIFGYKCKYGHWDEWILREEDALRLKAMVEDFLTEDTSERKSGENLEIS